MKSKIFYIHCLIFLFSILILSKIKAKDNEVPLIPLPARVEWHNGKFLLSEYSVIESSETMLSEYFVEQIKNLTGMILRKQSGNTNKNVFFRIDSTLDQSNHEAYSLLISETKVEITGSDKIGIFRGLQTFFQLISPSVKSAKSQNVIEIPTCKISDKPFFSWRGLNLDCCRHFMSKDFIKRYIDILAYYKFNVFHWHLTEDQGWRVEIKKYPPLTEIGAWRKESDDSIYGGYYTQEDIKEIVSYAQSRFITIVPEIEMPGHSLASLASYPQNSCTGGPFEVTNIWGVHKDIYCAGRDSTFYFLQGILDEITELFPGEYIHIGGDEAPKDRWEECPKCQARISAEGLKDEHELQSYFIKRISAYLQSKGKKIIGWDEILQGGLAPGAIVQSWQSFSGAVESANLGHYTICSPASHTYLNHSPEDLDLRVAYSFNPVPDELSESQQKYVIGSEANLWTENAPQPTVDGKLFPRLLALAEVFWSNPLNKNYDNFYQRVQESYADLTAFGIEYGPETKAILPSSMYDETKNEFIVEVTQGQKGLVVRYTLNGSEPGLQSKLYTEPLRINKTSDVKIAAFKDNQLIGRVFNLSFDFHKALNSKLTIINPYDERYRAGGENSLIDGVRGTNNFRDNTWQGYNGVDFEGIIDLREKKNISKVVPRFILDSNSWIFLPEKVKVSFSSDGKNFTDTKEILNDIDQKTSEIVPKDFSFEFPETSTRYIKVNAENIKVCPEWHPGAGSKAWIFIDEIVVE